MAQKRLDRAMERARVTAELAERLRRNSYPVVMDCPVCSATIVQGFPPPRTGVDYGRRLREKRQTPAMSITGARAG